MRRLLILSLLALTACATVGGGPGERWVPYPDVVEWIKALPKESGKLSCSRKAALAVFYYRSKGLSAWVVSGPWSEQSIKSARVYTSGVSIQLPDIRHAWTEVENPLTGQRYLVDPSQLWNNDEGRPAKYRDRDRIYTEKEYRRELAWALAYLKTTGLRMPE